MFHRFPLLVCLAGATAVSALLCSSPVRGDDVARLPDQEARAYRAILPAQSETRWQQIP
jgi:hypothetical protein